MSSKDISIRPFKPDQSFHERALSRARWINKSVIPTLRRVGLYFGDFDWLISQLDFSKCTFDDHVKYDPSYQFHDVLYPFGVPEDEEDED